MSDQSETNLQARGEERGRIMGGLVPGRMHGSPADMRPAPLDALTPEFATIFDSRTPWYRPGWWDAIRALKWKVLLLVPAVVIVVGVPVTVFLLPNLGGGMWQLEFKLWLFALGVVISLVLWGMKHATTARTDDFCIHCGYTLHGLGEEGTCPECGRPFSINIAREFRKDPHFFADRWRALQDAPRFAAFAAGDGPTPDDGTR